MNLLAYQPTWWTLNPQDNGRYWVLLGVCVAGMAMFFALSRVPHSARRPIVVGVTFLAGLFWVLRYLWPEPIALRENELPNGFVEKTGQWLQTSVPFVSSIAQVITSFLLGLGLFSLLRVHFTKITRKQRDWQYSVLLLTCMGAMIAVGYTDWLQREFWLKERITDDTTTWTNMNVAFNVMFDGLLQNMDAAMFSIIAFYIFSAAYRAFRIRSMEATLLMSSALIVMLSLMGAVTSVWNGAIDGITGTDPANLMNNLKLNVLAGWLRNVVQVPALQALEFGVGLGTLAMALRLWLGLERGGVTE